MDRESLKKQFALWHLNLSNEEIERVMVTVDEWMKRAEDINDMMRNSQYMEVSPINLFTVSPSVSITSYKG